MWDSIASRTQRGIVGVTAFHFVVRDTRYSNLLFALEGMSWRTSDQWTSQTEMANFSIFRIYLSLSVVHVSYQALKCAIPLELTLPNQHIIDVMGEDGSLEMAYGATGKEEQNLAMSTEE